MDILLVEDSKLDALLLKKVFLQNSNAPEFHWVPDVNNALDYVFQRKQYQHAHRPDMIILDLKLPRISGYELLRGIKEVPSLSSISIVVFTTSVNPLGDKQCKALGADICLPKPNNMKEYENTVQGLLDHTFPHSPATASRSHTG